MTMKMDDWGQEPFDLRLTLFRLIRKLPVILALILAGTLLFGGGYYVKNVLLQTQKEYAGSVQFLVDYADEDWADTQKYINEYSWNVWMENDEFISYVEKYLPEGMLSEKEVSECLSAVILSDFRVVVITATSDDPGTAAALLEAVKSAMVEDFPAGFQDVTRIRATDADPVEEVKPDVRPVRAFVLAAVLCTLFVLAGFLLAELSSDRIFLPESISRRFGIKNCGITGSRQFRENLEYFFEGKKKIAICPAGQDVDAQEIAKELESLSLSGGHSFVPVSCPMQDEKAVKTLREADGILLAAAYGRQDSRGLGLLLDYLTAQDCEVTAAMLANPDNTLLKTYYRLGGTRNLK